MDLLDFIADQNSKSDLADWAKTQYGQSNPALAQLAAADPNSFRQILPNLVQKQQEAEALSGLYGKTTEAPKAPTLQAFGEGNNGDQIPGMAIPQSLPTDPMGQLQAPVQQPSGPTAIQKIAAALPSLPAGLQSIFGQQLALQGMGGESGGGSVVDKQAEAIANYQLPPLSSYQLKSPVGMAIQNAVLDKNPDYDATHYKERTKTAQDFSAGGSAGQKITQAQTTINHLASYMDAADKYGGVDAGPASAPLNSIRNWWNSQDKDRIAASQFGDLGGDELAKMLAGSNGSTEADRRQNEGKFTLSNGPDARKAAAQTAIQAIFGKLEPVTDQYNKSYGTSKTAFDLLSPETQQSLAKLGMTPEGAQEQAPQSALSQMQNPQASPQITPEMARAELARRKKAK